MSGQNSLAALKSAFNMTSVPQTLTVWPSVPLIPWMVDVRNTGRDGVAHDLGVIELPFAAIRASDEDLAHRIDRAVPGTAFTEPEVARVLMQKRGEHGGRHKSASPSVGVECTEALRVTLQTLSIRWIAVPSLADQGHRTDERNRDRIGHCFCGELEFGLCRERPRLIPVLDSQVVRQDPEKAIVFGSNLRLRRRLNTEVALQAKLLMRGSDRQRDGARRGLLLGIYCERAQKYNRSGGAKEFSHRGLIQVGHSANAAKSRRRTVLLQSVTLTRRTGCDVLPKATGREPPNRSNTVVTKSDAKPPARSPSLRPPMNSVSRDLRF